MGRRAVLEDGDGCSSGEGRETQGPSKDSLVDGVSAPNTWQNRGPENSEPNSNSSIKVENQMLSRPLRLWPRIQSQDLDLSGSNKENRENCMDEE